MFNARELQKSQKMTELAYILVSNKFRIKYNNNTNRTFGLWPPTL